MVLKKRYMEKSEIWRKKPKFSRYRGYRTGHVWDEVKQRFITEYPYGDKGEYRIVAMKDDDGKWHTGIKLHRFIAELFIENSDNLPEVNHKDEDGSNNCVDNLEWCTRKYNCNYGTKNQRCSEKMTNGKLSKKVYQYTLDGDFVREWVSMSEVHRQLGIKTGELTKCCQGKNITSGGYQWRWEKYDRINPFNGYSEHYTDLFGIPVYQYTLAGDYVGEYRSVTEAGRQFSDTAFTSISGCCNGSNKSAFGFQWSHEKHHSIPPYKRKTNARPIIQCTMDGKLVKEWPSASAACEENGYNKSLLFACLRGKYKQCYGFVWKRV